MITQFPEADEGLTPMVEDLAVMAAGGRFHLVRTDEAGQMVETIGSQTDDWRTIELLIAVFRQ